jgi:hypothetical protein
MPGNAFSSFADSILRGGGLALSAQMLNQQAQQEQAIALQREQREYDAQLEERRNQQTLDLEERRAAYQDGKEYVKWLRDQAVGIRKLKPEDNPDYDLAGKYEAQANQIQNYLGGYVRSPNFVQGLASLKATPLTYNQQATVAAYETTPNSPEGIPAELEGNPNARFYEGYSNAAGSKQAEIPQTVTAEAGAGIATAATATAEANAERLKRIQAYKDSFNSSMATGLMNLASGLEPDSQAAVLAVVTNLSNPDATFDLTTIPGLKEKVKPGDVAPAIAGLQALVPDLRVAANAIRESAPDDPTIAQIDAFVAEVGSLGQLAVSNPTQALQRALELGKDKVTVKVNGEDVEINPQDLIRGGSQAARVTGDARKAFESAQGLAKGIPENASVEQQEAAGTLTTLTFDEWQEMGPEQRQNLLKRLRKTPDQMAIPDVLAYVREDKPLIDGFHKMLANDPSADPVLVAAAKEYGRQLVDVRDLGWSQTTGDKGAVKTYSRLESEGVTVPDPKAPGGTRKVTRTEIEAAAEASTRNQPLDTRGFDYQAHIGVSLSDDYDDESRANARQNAADAKAGKPLSKPTNYKKITDAKTLAQNKLTTLLSASTALNNQKSPLSDDQQTARSTIAGMTPEELMSNPEMYSTLLDMLRSDDPDLSVQAPFMASNYDAVSTVIAALSRKEAAPAPGALEAATAIQSKLDEAIGLATTNPKRAQELLNEIRNGVDGWTISKLKGAAEDANFNVQRYGNKLNLQDQFGMSVKVDTVSYLRGIERNPAYTDADRATAGTLAKDIEGGTDVKTIPLFRELDFKPGDVARYMAEGKPELAIYAYDSLKKRDPNLVKDVPQALLDDARDQVEFAGFERTDSLLARVSEIRDGGDTDRLSRWQGTILGNEAFGKTPESRANYWNAVQSEAVANRKQIEASRKAATLLQNLTLAGGQTEYLNALVEAGDSKTLAALVKTPKHGITSAAAQSALDRVQTAGKDTLVAQLGQYANLGKLGIPLIKAKEALAAQHGIKLEDWTGRANLIQKTLDDEVANGETTWAKGKLETWTNLDFSGAINPTEAGRAAKAFGMTPTQFSTWAAAIRTRNKATADLAKAQTQAEIDKARAAIAESNAQIKWIPYNATTSRISANASATSAAASTRNAATGAAQETRLAAAQDDGVKAAKAAADIYTKTAVDLRKSAAKLRNPTGADGVLREATPEDLAKAEAMEAEATRNDQMAAAAIATIDPALAARVGTAAATPVPTPTTTTTTSTAPPKTTATTNQTGGQGSNQTGNFTPTVGTATKRPDGGMDYKIGGTVIPVKKEFVPGIQLAAVRIGRMNDATYATQAPGLIQEQMGKLGWKNTPENFQKMASIIATTGKPAVTLAPKKP